MTIAKAIVLTAALGTALVFGSAAERSSTSLPVQLHSASSSGAANEHVTPVARCGGEANTDSIALQRPLPNAYMIANGRVFSLAEVIGCAKRLHSTRIS